MRLVRSLFAILAFPAAGPLAAQTADVSLSQTASPNPVSPGGSVTFTLTLTNLGPDAAGAVSVATVFSPELQPLSCTTSLGQASCNALGTGGSFNSLVVGASVTVTLVATVAPATPNGVIVSSAAKIAQSPLYTDPNPANDQATASVSVFSGPQAVLSPGSLDFASEGLLKTSAPQYLTLTSAGGALAISGITTDTAEYTQTNDCPTSIPSGGRCTIGVRFTPSATGVRPGTLKVADNGAGSPQTVSLTGVGVRSFVSPSTTLVSFEPRRVGTASLPRLVTLTNRAQAPLNITGVAVDSADFALLSGSSSCASPGTLRPGASCVLGVTFTPHGSGRRLGTVSITDDDPASPQRIGLLGQGEAVSLSTPLLTFAGVTLGLASTLTESLSVTGDTAVSFTGASLGGPNAGDFSIPTDGCSGTSVSSARNCTLSVRFSPHALGPRHATLTLSDTDPASPETVLLVGYGKAPVLTTLSVSPVNPVLGVGKTQPLTAQATYDNGTNRDITSQARWMSSDRTVATVGNTTGSYGIVTALAPGVTTITAAFGGMTARTALTSYVIPFVSFSVQPTTTPVVSVISPAVTVRVVDAAGHPVPEETVTIALGPNPPNPAVLHGTLARTAAGSGTAVFGNLSLDYFGSGYTLVASVTTPGGTYSATSGPFDATRVGDACLAPDRPACASGCLDRDGDGLNDAWEAAGGIDVNGDGSIDAQRDVLLPGAEPAKPDIFVHYDWMRYGLGDTPCAIDLDCTSQSGLGHAGETCTGPPTPYSTHSCVRACAVDSDCTAIGPSHVGDRCLANMCQHTHDPEVLAPGSLQAVVDSFAAHGINLHVIRGQAVPHSHVVSFRPLAALNDTCEGGSVGSGTAGLGRYAESLYDLKPASMNPATNPAYHYAVFGHLSSCDDITHCDTLLSTGTCPATKGSRPQLGQSGQAELPGNDFVVTFGNFVNDLGVAPDKFIFGGTFMHELGHNLGLVHGGGVAEPDGTCQWPCEHIPNYKPNYLSVMNYSYQVTGIPRGAVMGSSVPAACDKDADCMEAERCLIRAGVHACSRLDYSNDVLPTAGNTPGALWEDGQLNEPAGLGSGNADLFLFTDGACYFRIGASEGPVDWDGDGFATNANATADLNPNDHPLFACEVRRQVLHGHADWGPAPSQSAFRYAFQCNSPNFADGISASRSGGTPEPEWALEELTPESAARAHVLYPPRPIRIVLQPGCKAKEVAPGRAGRVVVAILGEKDLDLGEVDLSSLGLHGARPVDTEVRDVDGDGIPDLLVGFDAGHVKLHPKANAARLSGWLKNSQVIYGEGPVTVTATAETLCYP